MTGSLNTLNWADYRTAYGDASLIPKMLERLESNNSDEALNAASELWASLCHQHAYISSAALPALPYILKVLDNSEPALSIEILDILLGFSVCTTDGERHCEWIDDLHTQISRERGRFVELSQSEDEEIADFAAAIIESIDARA